MIVISNAGNLGSQTIFILFFFFFLIFPPFFERAGDEDNEMLGGYVGRALSQWFSQEAYPVCW